MQKSFSFQTLSFSNKQFGYYSLKSLGIDLARLPYSIRILLESVLRNADAPFSTVRQVTEEDVKNLAAWSANSSQHIEIPFKPARVLLQDFTGVPAVVDLAAMRSAMERFDLPPCKINPLIPVDLVVDHSIQTDYYGTSDALEKNSALEFHRNSERYALLHWAQKSLDNFRVVPPSVGIIHQVNLEYLADVVHVGKAFRTKSGEPELPLIFPDSVLGTDSHTVMINGLGVLGWGVGGIEAEAVMLGQPYYMLAPQVVGFELVGKLRPHVTATDLVLTITELLRKEGVVGKFVEYFGPGVASMPLADRAVLANMGPEYGATMGFFPVDEQTIRFLHETGRNAEHIELVEKYCKEQMLFASSDQPIPNYSKVLTLHLSDVEACLAGPKRPQDRLPLGKVKACLAQFQDKTLLEKEGSQEKHSLQNGSVVIASITSCTNTSNPNLMIAAGLVAKKAIEKGMVIPNYVKTSLAPGSRVVTDYLEKADLLKPLESLGFYVAGYGCMTCIGNSGPLPESVETKIKDENLTVCAVLSGNRNFEGRVHPLVKANFLASPPLVVIYALAGTMNIDLTTEPVGKDGNGKPVFLSDLFPSDAEVAESAKSALSSETYQSRYNDVFNSNSNWNAIPTNTTELFNWNRKSTYIQEPPFLDRLILAEPPKSSLSIDQARCLLLLGDSVTTDHISPAGSIKPDSPAGKYLIERGVSVSDFNSYGSRRGNDRVMARGTFANIRIRNLLIPGTEGGVTKYFPTGEILPVYDAAMKYQETRTPLVIIAGLEYGTGSSRDWAAKGTALLGVKAVFASSFERIHRGNLVGMGILPLEFLPNATWETLQLTGEEEFSLPELTEDFKPGSEISVHATKKVAENRFMETTFNVKVRIDTLVEWQYYLNGGILQTVLRGFADL
ncbi:MAG: aconitate hydratase AcnA [Thermoguttaceae bacterium]